jgi:hypothetical protein
MTDDTEKVHDEGDAAAEGGDGSESADKLPGAPSEDGTPLGDTDQHSEAPSPPAQTGGPGN